VTTPDSPAPDSGTAFQPTRGRVAFAAALALIAFFLPQEVPLEWYPLNEPGEDILYLELTCASDRDGEVQIFYNATQGINQLHSISFPISPTKQTFTYTFPLLDAPIVELRVDPPAHGATLDIRRMRILDRRGTEMRRFTYDLFRPVAGIAAITPQADGWSITTDATEGDPRARIELFSPIIAKDLSWRNLLRSLLSTGYLAMMLWIILLAVLFACARPRHWRELVAPVAFMALLALLFAPVGNRGLIRNSLHYARYVPPAVPPGLRLEFDLVSSGPSPAQLYWDTGRGINGDDSRRVLHEAHAGLQHLRFDLPDRPVRELRFDPRDNPGSVRIRGIRVVDQGQRTRAVVPLDSLVPLWQVARAEIEDEFLVIETTPDASDPVLNFNQAAIEIVNRAIAGAGGPL